MYKYNSVAGLQQHVNCLVMNWISSRYKLAVKTGSTGIYAIIQINQPNNRLVVHGAKCPLC